MDPQRLTQKTQEALHDAQTKALRYGHTEVDPEHLLLALLEQPDGLAARLVDRAAGDADTLRTAVRQQLERRPRVSRPGRRRQLDRDLPRARPGARRRARRSPSG